MPGNIKGIIVEIGGDTSKLQKALNKVNSQSNSLSKELKGINSLLKLDPKNVELLSQKQEILNQSIDTTQDKLQQLQKIKEEADKKMASGGKISEENYRNLQREIISTQNKLNGLTDELKQFNAENTQLSKASKKIEEYGNKISKVSDKVNDLGNKASVVSGAVVAGGVALVNSAMSVEDAVAKYVSSTNTAANETERYKTILENINKANYGDGYEDIANSMAAVKMQLKDINDADLESITEKAIALRDLFGYDVSESIRAVKALMDNFSVTADESFNLIAEGKKQGLDFSNELLDNVNEYSVQFKKLGLSAEDMFNIFKVGSENGAFNLDKIGDAVKEFSIRAIDGSNTTSDGFKRIGLNADEMAKKFANGGETAKQAFIEVVNRLGKMDDKVSQSVAGVDLFGTMWEDLGPTVISSFSKMDAGISKSSNSMQESIDELYDTTKKKAETQLKRLQSLGADFGEEMLPVLEKIIDKAEDFIDCLEDMSDEEKENVAKIALLVAGFGPLTKVVGTAGSAIGTITKGLGKFKEAMNVVDTGVKSTSSGINILSNIITAFKSPVGLATTALTALAAATVYVIQKGKELDPEVKKATDNINKMTEAYNESNDAAQQQISAGIAQMDYIQRLREELNQLVDANGKVKDGYKERVDFILGELNEALGTEYTQTDGVIQKYKELSDNIDLLIQKKKAEVILDANKDNYVNALTERTKAQSEYSENLNKQIELENDLVDLKDKLTKKTEEMNEAEKKGQTGAYSAYETAKSQAQFYETQIQQKQKDLDAQKQNVQSSYELYKKYTELIGADDKLQTALLTNNTETIKLALQERTNNMIQQAMTGNETLAQQIEKEGLLYQSDLTLKQDYVSKNQLENAKLVEDDITAGQQRLANLSNQLVEETNKITELSPAQVEAWKSLANASYLEYSNGISKLSPDMQTKIQEATGVLIASRPEFAQRAGEVGTEVANNFDKNAEAKEKALNTLQGFYEGLNDDEKKELLKTTVGDRADEVAKEFESGDYQTSGENVLKGLYNGLNNGKLGQSLITKAASIARSVAEQFNIQWDEHSPSKLMKKKAEYLLQPIGTVFEKEEGKLKNISKSVARSVIEGFDRGGFDKLLNVNTNQKMQSANIPSNTTNNNITYVANIYAQTVNEQNLKTIFDYMNRRFGNIYS